MAQKGKSVLLPNGLTPKQNQFKNKVIEQIKAGKNPNGTEAAIQTYDTTDRNTANAIASENLANPIIRKSIKDELEAIGLSREKLIGNLGKIATIPVTKASADTIVKINLELLKLTEPRRGEGGVHNTVNMINISFSEAKKQLEVMNGETEGFLSEAE